MPHIQISDTRFVNTDHIAICEAWPNPADVELTLVTGIVARVQRQYVVPFMEAYQRLCVAKQRPEVG